VTETPLQVERRRREHLQEWCKAACPVCLAPPGTPCSWVRSGPELLAGLAHASRINRVLADWPNGHHGVRAKR
jgi:hypothetical protein